MRAFLALALLWAGCSTTRVVEVPAPPEAKPMVWVRGDVKNRAVTWSEELTLSRAIVAAQYTGLWDPHSISVVRGGTAYKINPRDLLKQLDDPFLEPGDVIVIER